MSRDAGSKERRAPLARAPLAFGLCAIVAMGSFACGERRKAVEHNNKAFALLAQKRFTEAITSFDAALAADPKLPEAHLGLGRAYDETQQAPKAEEALKKYTSMRTTDGDGFYYLGLALDAQKRFADAVTAYQKAAGLAPTPRHHLVYFRMAKDQVKLGQPNDAAESFRKALKANPTFLRAYEELASVYADNGDLGSAEQALQNALATKQPDAHVHSSLGLVYSKMADRLRDEAARNVQLERAASQFDAAIKLKPSYARAYWNLGMTLAKITKEGSPARRKDAVKNLQLFLSRHGKDDDLTTQANDMIVHLSR